jgi:hypothetical protein
MLKGRSLHLLECQASSNGDLLLSAFSVFCLFVCLFVFTQMNHFIKLCFLFSSFVLLLFPLAALAAWLFSFAVN